MWDKYLAVGVTLMLQIVQNDDDKSKHRKMLLKVFRAIGQAFAADAEFKKAANEAFK